MTYSTFNSNTRSERENFRTASVTYRYTEKRPFSFLAFVQHNVFWILSIFLIFCFFIGHIQTIQAQNIQNKISANMSMVYNVCNESRISASIPEQQCAELQDATNVEFLCNQNNNLSTNHCWTEYKGSDLSGARLN